MRLPLRLLSSSLRPARFACGLGFAVALASPAYSQVQVPISQILAEADTNINARRPADAAELLGMILDRISKGEALPAGVTLDRVELLAATTYFQSQNFPRAAEIAEKLLKHVPTGQVAGDARLVLGLSLALQNKFAEAIPVFTALQESVTHREKALMYRAMAAQQAGQFPVAIDALTQILTTSPHDADWADSALTLIALHLQQKNLDAARRGLVLLRRDLDTVENLAGLNILSLQLGDGLLATNDPAGALTAYRTVLGRDELVRLQKIRTARMESNLARMKALTRGSAADMDAVRRVEARIKATKDAVAEIEKNTAYDAVLFYRLGHTFNLRGGVWESALLFERLLTEFPESEERERAFLGLVRAYADAGRIDKMKGALDRFLRILPNSPLLPQALYVGAQAAADKGRADLQLSFLDIGVERFPQADLREFMLLMQANAHFGAGRYEEARKAADTYVTTIPNGQFAEDATYLRAMASFVLGNTKQAMGEVESYLQKFPKGRFVADARYRQASASYAMQDYADAEKKVAAWLTDFSTEDPQRGEVLSLQGDVYAGQEKIAEAIASYRAALLLPLSDDQLGYVLDELTRHYQARREFSEAATMWEDFAREKPDHPFVINAAYWIGRLRAREGRMDEAVEQMSEIARRYVTDPSRDAVERLLTQIAAIIAKPGRPGADGKRPPAPTADEVRVRVDRLLLRDGGGSSATAKARSLFTQAEIASLRKDNPLRDKLLTRIASTPPEALPPGLLGRVGDLVREQGKTEAARSYYEYLVSHYPRSIYADFGYVGLGELAFAAGEPDAALDQFSFAIDRAGARFKLMEATLGRAKSLLAKGNLDAAKELFEQIAGNRSWRGPATAQSVYSLGEILVKRGGSENLAQAQAHFQRVYISYRKFAPWVARAYLSSGETFEKLGQPKEALATYREMLRDERLSAYPETQKARDRITVLEPQVGGAS